MKFVLVKLDPSRHFQCLPAKFTLNNYHNGIGTEEWESYEDVVENCEMMCGAGACDDLEDGSMENADHCARTRFHYSFH